MKILLAILCAIIVLFTGGCALILVTGAGYNGMFQSFPLALIPAGLALLNVLVIVGLFGRSPPQRWAFYVLAVLDVLVVLTVLSFLLSYGGQDSELNFMAGLFAGAFALKAGLTLLYARRL